MALFEEQPVMVTISSGRGPAECERAVTLFADWLGRSLAARGGAVRILSRQAGLMPEGASSLNLEATPRSPEDAAWIDSFAGTVQWICPSPYRPGHRRKNWFIQVELSALAAQPPAVAIQPGEVRFETARSSGKGGQHVNTTETAVRAVHLPTGLAAVSRDERSQLSNKKTALRRLEELLAERQRHGLAAEKARLRQRHDFLERGNAAAVFRGPDFEPAPCIPGEPN